jgi:hypothetical protein
VRDVTTALSDDVWRGGGINGNLGAANGRILRMGTSAHGMIILHHSTTPHEAGPWYSTVTPQGRTPAT